MIRRDWQAKKWYYLNTHYRCPEMAELLPLNTCAVLPNKWYRSILYYEIFYCMAAA